ncbi:hypothetical protein ES703_87655 [subsurface metagenome]
MHEWPDDEIRLKPPNWVTIAPRYPPEKWAYGAYYYTDLAITWGFVDHWLAKKEKRDYLWHSFLYLDVWFRVGAGDWFCRGSFYPPNVQSGSYTVEDLLLPVWLGVGFHEIQVTVWAWALYKREGNTDWLLGARQSSIASFRIEVIEATPLCSFTVSETVGYAPFYVEFTDTSESLVDAPIISWLWDFGDGETSPLRSPTHVYNRPGTYTVRLTVANEYGSDSAERTINVLAGAARPVFVRDKCAFPASVGAEEPFTPKLTIENEGGPGNVYLNVVAKGEVIPLFESVAIEGYKEYEFDMGSHAIGWYLPQTPTAAEMVGLKFETGPVGEDPTSEYSTAIAVTVRPEGPCTEGDFKCMGYDRYICRYGAWVFHEENSEACGYAPPKERKWWPYVLAGAGGLLGLGTIIYLVRRK